MKTWSILSTSVTQMDLSHVIVKMIAQLSLTYQVHRWSISTLSQEK